jgi:hypothetical protein
MIGRKVGFMEENDVDPKENNVAAKSPNEMDPSNRKIKNRGTSKRRAVPRD